MHLPILYGEAKEKALGRLLEEIVSQSGDTSVLDWIGRPSSFHSCFPASIESYRFAPSAQPELDGATFERSLSKITLSPVFQPSTSLAIDHPSYTEDRLSAHGCQ